LRILFLGGGQASHSKLAEIHAMLFNVRWPVEKKTWGSCKYYDEWNVETFIVCPYS
jgi:hypothetical protein